MKVAVIGSRGLTIADLRKYLPEDTTEIVSGGARGAMLMQESMPLNTASNLPNFDRITGDTAGEQLRLKEIFRLLSIPT